MIEPIDDTIDRIGKSSFATILGIHLFPPQPSQAMQGVIFSSPSHPILKLCIEKRGIQKDINFSGNRVVINFHLPLNEVIFDFHDRIKSISQGYASFDYEITDYQSGKLDKVNILVNGEIVESLAFITHKEKAVSRGRTICSKLKDSIPKQLFKVAIQAAIGSKAVSYTHLTLPTNREV